MKAFAGVVSLLGLVASALAPSSPQAARAEELINRREQARQSFLATPQGVYRHYCAHCHGEDGKGGGRLWVSDLPAVPADLTALGKDKEYVAAVIRDGSAPQGKSNLCPPWGRTISPANVERLAQYIMSLNTQASQPATASVPVREPFPWAMLIAVLVEMVLLGALLRRREGVSNVIPQGPVGRG